MKTFKNHFWLIFSYVHVLYILSFLNHVCIRVIFSRMSQSYFYFSLRCNSYHVTSGCRAVDTKIPESRMAPPAASRGLLKGNLEISSLLREFVTALLILLCQKIEARIQIICGQHILIF